MNELPKLFITLECKPPCSKWPWRPPTMPLDRLLRVRAFYTRSVSVCHVKCESPVCSQQFVFSLVLFVSLLFSLSLSFGCFSCVVTIVLSFFIFSTPSHHFGVGRRGVDSGRDNHLDCHQAAVPVTTATAVVAAAAVAGNWMWTESLDIPYTFPNVTQAVEQRAVLTIDFVAPIAPLDDNENASTTTTILRPLFLDEGAVLESLFASTYNDVLGGCDSLFGRVVTTATLDCDDTTCCQLVSNDNNNAVWGDTKVQCNLTARFWCQDNCTSLFGTEDDEGEFVISTTITVESSNTDEPTTSSTSSNPESTTLATTTPSQPKMTNNAVVGASQQQSLNVFAFTQQPPPRPIDQASTSSSVMSSSSYTKLQSTFVTQK